MADLTTELKTALADYESKGESGCDWNQLERAAHAFFSAHANDFHCHNAFVNGFTRVWDIRIRNGQHHQAAEMWRRPLEIMRKWETAQTGRLHKGSIFYWWGASAALGGATDDALLMMHEALFEDELSRRLGTDVGGPPRAFVRLEKQNQSHWMHEPIVRLAEFVENDLDAYRRLRNGRLSFRKLQQRLLDSQRLRGPAFQFVHAISRTEGINRITDAASLRSEFAGLLCLGILFDLCLVIDNVICYRIRPKGRHMPKDGKPLFKPLLDELSKRSGSRLYPHSKSLDPLRDVNRRMNVDFAKCISQALTGTFRVRGIGQLTPIEIDMAITYGLRNQAAHSLKGRRLIAEKFNMLRRAVLNILFLAVEKL